MESPTKDLSKHSSKVSSKPPSKVSSKPPSKVRSKPPSKIRSKPPSKKVRSKPASKIRSKPPSKVRSKPKSKPISQKKATKKLKKAVKKELKKAQKKLFLRKTERAKRDGRFAIIEKKLSVSTFSSSYSSTLSSSTSSTSSFTSSTSSSSYSSSTTISVIENVIRDRLISPDHGIAIYERSLCDTVRTSNRGGNQSQQTTTWRRTTRESIKKCHCVHREEEDEHGVGRHDVIYANNNGYTRSKFAEQCLQTTRKNLTRIGYLDNNDDVNPANDENLQLSTRATYDNLYAMERMGYSRDNCPCMEYPDEPRGCSRRNGCGNQCCGFGMDECSCCFCQYLDYCLCPGLSCWCCGCDIDDCGNDDSDCGCDGNSLDNVCDCEDTKKGKKLKNICPPTRCNSTTCKAKKKNVNWSDDGSEDDPDEAGCCECSVRKARKENHKKKKDKKRHKYREISPTYSYTYSSDSSSSSRSPKRGKSRSTHRRRKSYSSSSDDGPRKSTQRTKTYSSMPDDRREKSKSNQKVIKSHSASSEDDKKKSNTEIKTNSSSEGEESDHRRKRGSSDSSDHSRHRHRHRSSTYYSSTRYKDSKCRRSRRCSSTYSRSPRRDRLNCCKDNQNCVVPPALITRPAIKFYAEEPIDRPGQTRITVTGPKGVTTYLPAPKPPPNSFSPSKCCNPCQLPMCCPPQMCCPPSMCCPPPMCYPNNNIQTTQYLVS